MANNRKLGSDKEIKAAEYLRQNNIEILVMNFRSKQGEIDIIGKDGEYLVFIEVKYRTSDIFGLPREAVNHSKQRKIKQTAMSYLKYCDIYDSVNVRFDVIDILDDEITHIKDAF